jgi:hypothetical protein
VQPQLELLLILSALPKNLQAFAPVEDENAFAIDSLFRDAESLAVFKTNIALRVFTRPMSGPVELDVCSKQEATSSSVWAITNDASVLSPAIKRGEVFDGLKRAI